MSRRGQTTTTTKTTVTKTTVNKGGFDTKNYEIN